MAWVRASIPVAAVTEAGTDKVSSGSQMATFAAVKGLFTVILYLFFVSVITEEKVSSLPVPDVVGTVIIRGSGSVAAVFPSYFLISVAL